MTSNQFLTFQKFSNQEDAIVLKENLEKGQIEVYIEDTSVSVDITFTGNPLGNEFLLKIKQSDFSRAHEILERQAESVVEQYSRDHYLYEFSDEELFDLVEKSDEWSKEDYILAQQILKERGHDVSKEKIEKIRKKRLRDLRKPEKADKLGFRSGSLGFLVAWSHWKSTKLDLTGKRYYVYDEETRKSGKTTFLLWVAATIVLVIISILRN